LLAKAKLKLTSSQKAANDALALMQAEVKKKESMGFVDAPAAERQKIQMQIVIRAKEAQAAAAKLKEAQMKAQAAETSWALKMKEIRLQVAKQQETTRLAVM